MKRWIRISLLAVVALSVSCAGSLGESIRAATYPPSFRYIPKEELRSTMWELAARAAELDRLMHVVDEGTVPPNERVLEVLREMERTMRALGPGGWPSNHPQVSRNVDDFRDYLEKAIRDAQRQPPSYYRAGAVAGACTRCHADS